MKFVRMLLVITNTEIWNQNQELRLTEQMQNKCNA